ncbi:MAG: N-formylglutamate amidohydrolase [Methylobacteriaceae bacterium]|nr:N-formylglutamate amidohydrolase [Methylobacteriaceae bacterium]
MPLLSDGDPTPVLLHRPDGASPILLACDHYGRLIPASLGRLGLPERELVRHIAWDIGIAGVTTRLADALDAAMVAQRYSRLVIDCNRPPEVASSIPEVSETTEIPGNLELTPAARAERLAAIFAPYHAAITATLAARNAAGRPTVLVAMHSFTPVFRGVSRPWHIGTLYGRDGRLARRLGALLAEEPNLVVGDNEPYRVTDGTDYTIPVHAERPGLLHVGIEIRQDLIAGETGQAEWADRLARLLPVAIAGFPLAPARGPAVAQGA